MLPGRHDHGVVRHKSDDGHFSVRAISVEQMLRSPEPPVHVELPTDVNH
jgi:hypothetical protein